MNWIARMLADEDFRDGMTVIVTVVIAGFLLIVGEKIAVRLFPNTPKSTEAAFEAAGLEIVRQPECPDIVADAAQKPHYLNGCECEDCAEWVPTDDEIAAFIAGRREGGDVR